MSFSLILKSAAELAAEAEAAWRAEIAAAVDAHVEAQALALGYNSAAALAGYRDCGNAGWSAEAAAFVDWRRRVWEAVYAAEAAPVTIEAVIAALPAWAA